MVKMFLFRWFYSVPAALSSCFYSLLDALGLRQTEAKIWFVGFDHAAKITLLQKLIDEKLIDEQIIQRQLNQDAIPMELSTRKIIFRTNVWGIPQIAGKIKFKAFDVGSLQNARMFLQEYYAKEVWCDSQGTLEEIRAKLQMRQEGAIKRERAIAYALSHQQWRSNSKTNMNYARIEPDKNRWGWELVRTLDGCKALGE